MWDGVDFNFLWNDRDKEGFSQVGKTKGKWGGLLRERDGRGVRGEGRGAEEMEVLCRNKSLFWIGKI